LGPRKKSVAPACSLVTTVTELFGLLSLDRGSRNARGCVPQHACRGGCLAIGDVIMKLVGGRGGGGGNVTVSRGGTVERYAEWR
jgi:hypothetical protein